MPLRRGPVHYFEEGEPANEDRSPARPRLKVVTLLFAPNPELFPALSSCAGYDTTWVDKLARGVRRHLPGTEVICLVDRDYTFEEPVRAVKVVEVGSSAYGTAPEFAGEVKARRGYFASERPDRTDAR